MVDVLSNQRLLPRLTRLLEAFRAIRSARLADDNHLGTNVVTNTLQTTDEALRTLAITATDTYTDSTTHPGTCAINTVHIR